MLVIRLNRVAKKNQPSFQIVVTDKRNAPRGGRFIEKLGYLNPLTKKFSLKEERVKYWISKGAKCSDTVHNLLVREKIIEGRKVDVHKKSKKKKESSSVKVAEGKEGEIKPAEVKEKPVEKPAEKAEEKPKKEEKPKEESKKEKK